MLDMAVFNFIVICLMVYYTFFFFRLSFKDKRTQLQNKNNKLEELRKVSIKTVEQQKEFINTKYPKSTEKFKFTWPWLGKILLIILISLLLYRAYDTIFKILKLQFPLWQVILIVILFPLLVNVILRVFNLETDDITIYFK